MKEVSRGEGNSTDVQETEKHPNVLVVLKLDGSQ